MLEDAHLFSALYGVMKVGYKQGYFATTSVLCRRLLELRVSAKVGIDASAKQDKSETGVAEAQLQYKANVRDTAIFGIQSHVLMCYAFVCAVLFN